MISRFGVERLGFHSLRFRLDFGFGGWVRGFRFRGLDFSRFRGLWFWGFKFRVQGSRYGVRG